jgi:hypothetical protein
MAETSWERLTPDMRVRGGEVRHVGPGWEQAQGKVEALDSEFHHPLPPPVELRLTPGEPVPTLPEGELRQRLVEALAAESEAQEALDRASAAHQRAEGHLQSCKQTLVSFEGLEAARDAHILEAIRAGGCPDLPDTLSAQLLAREKARMAFAGANAALLRLTNELADAQTRLAERTKFVEEAAAWIVARPADVIAQEIRVLRREIERRYGLLLGFDGYIGCCPAALPGSVSELIRGLLQGRIGTKEERAVWHDAAKRLRDNPMAEVTVSDPEPPPARPTMVVVTPYVAAVQAAQAQARAEREAKDISEEISTTKTPPEAA